MAGFTLFNCMCIFKLVGITHLVYALPAEPVCSKYDYEIRTLEAMLRTEQQVANMLTEIKENKNLIAKELESIKTTRDTVSKDLNELNELRSNLNLLVKNVEKNVSDQVEKMKLEKVTDEVTKSGMTVAFSVGNPTTSLVNGVPTFTTTITNIGGAYNVDTGVFTSPVDGLYLFLFTVASAGKYDVYCYIQHNGTYRVRGSTSSDNAYTTASASVYLLLTKGDTVTLGDCGGWSRVRDGQYDVRCYIQHNGASRVLGRTYSDNRLTTASASVYLLLTKGDTVTLGSCSGWSGVYSSSSTTFSGALIKQTH